MILFKRLFLMLTLCCISTAILAVPLPSHLTALTSAQGRDLFEHSLHKRDYWPLSRYFVTQKNLTYCGVASATILLNALKVPLKADSPVAPFKLHTQENIFTQQVRKFLPPEKVKRHGMTAMEMARLLSSFDLKVELFHTENSSLKQFRQLAKQYLKQPKHFILVNFSRRVLGEVGEGHISPVAAYHEKKDAFLIMDVARYKYPPFWVSAKDLWRAMNTQDSTTKKTRGFLLVSR